MFSLSTRNATLCLGLLSLISIQAYAQDIVFSEAPEFPEAAPGAYGILIDALSGGQLVVWNGDKVYRQTLPNGNQFLPIASGYVGDPGFLAVGPDGHTLLLGAGYSGKLYVLDAANPHDYVPGSEVATLAHYSGVFLTSTLVLLDRGVYPYAELGILDLTSGTYRAVMSKPAPADVDAIAGAFAASARLAVNASRTTVYTMSLMYDAGFAVIRNELKQIPVAALLAAYEASAELDWTTDALAIGGNGDFQDGGPSAVTRDGEVLIGGFGGVQRVNPISATVTATYQPCGFDYYAVGYNWYEDSVYPIASDLDWSMDVVYARVGELSSLPVSGVTGMIALVAVLTALSIIRLRRPATRRIS